MIMLILGYLYTPELEFLHNSSATSEQAGLLNYCNCHYFLVQKESSYQAFGLSHDLID
jgi:hypothetical protein